MRVRLVWLFSLPIMIGGWFAAHALSYRIAIPDSTARAQFLIDTGHGYLEYESLLLALAVVVFLMGAAMRVRTAARMRAAGATVAAWPFALLPPALFVFEEYTGRLVHSGSFEIGVLLEPTFVVGLLVQLPFALASFLFARVLLGVADRLGAALAPRERSVLRRPRIHLPRPPRTDLPRLRPIAAGQVDRGPPLLAIA
jgi:hypothetical protein